LTVRVRLFSHADRELQYQSAKTRHGIYTNDPDWSEPDIVEMHFASREDAHDWIIDNQLGRRNETPKRKSYLRGKQYRNQKTVGHGKKSADQNDTQNTAQRLAEKHGVGEATIKRDAEFSEAVDEIEKNVPGAKRDALSGKLTRARVKEVAALPPKEQAAALEEKEADAKPKSCINPMVGVVFRIETP